MLTVSIIGARLSDGCLFCTSYRCACLDFAFDFFSRDFPCAEIRQVSCWGC